MPSYDSATRARLADLLHALAQFAQDASRDVERDSLARTMERVQPDQPASPGAGRDYLTLGMSLGEILQTAVALCGQIAGARAQQDETARLNGLEHARSAAAVPSPDLSQLHREPRPDPELDARVAAFHARRGVLTRGLADVPPADRALEITGQWARVEGPA